MKSLFSLLAIVAVFSCSGAQPIGDVWEGMTPAQHADMLMDKPEKEIPTGLSWSQKKALIDFLGIVSPLAWRFF